MVWEKYLKNCCDTYPEYNLMTMYKMGNMSRPEFIRKMAEIFFISMENNSILAIETRNQLINLRTEGVLTFK